jgi:PAS domain-containing protein
VYARRVQAKDVELILARHLASYLAVPVCIVDPARNVIFYNEAAEPILGGRYEETGEMPQSEWSSRVDILDETGAPIPEEARPVVVAFAERRPVHRALLVKALDGQVRAVEATVLPLIGQANRLLGAFLIIWERPH